MAKHWNYMSVKQSSKLFVDCALLRSTLGLDVIRNWWRWLPETVTRWFRLGEDVSFEKKKIPDKSLNNLFRANGVPHSSESIKIEIPHSAWEETDCYFRQRKNGNHFIKTIFDSIHSVSFRKISGKKSKDSQSAIAGDSSNSCAICRKHRVAGDSSGSQSIANEPLLLTSCGNCSASICKSPACAIWSANRDCWECNDCHQRQQQQLNETTGYLQAYDWIFERLNRKFSERASAIPGDKSNVEQRRCCSNVMLDSNGNFIWFFRFSTVCWRLAGRAPINLYNFPFFIAGEPVLVPPPLQDRIRVREFIEDLISSMLGGSLDDVCVGRIYENIDCEYINRMVLPTLKAFLSISNVYSMQNHFDEAFAVHRNFF